MIATTGPMVLMMVTEVVWLSRDSVLAFDPKDVQKSQEEKHGESLRALAEREVTADNYQDFLQVVKGHAGRIADDIGELQKRNKRLRSNLESELGSVDDQRLEKWRDSNNMDIKPASIDVEDTLAYRIHQNLKLIESKRAYKTAHWRLAAKKLEEILVDVGTVDDVVKHRTDTMKAELVREIESSEAEIVDTVEQTGDSLSREHGQISRYAKSLIQMVQELSQHLSVSFDEILTDGMVSESSEGESGSNDDQVSEPSEEEEVVEDSSGSEGEVYRLDGRPVEEQKKVLDKMVSEIDGLDQLNKSNVANRTDVSRQALYYSESDIVGKVEEEFGVEYPELK